MTKSMVCYVSISVVSVFLAQLEHLNSDEVPNWTWVGWARFTGYLALAAFTTFKAYVARPPEIGVTVAETKQEKTVLDYEKRIEDHK